MKQGYVVTAWVKLGMQKYAEVDIVIRITLHYKADFMIKTVKHSTMTVKVMMVVAGVKV